jgi:NAD(P)-dependent dehydrogenase (short-subunit alcohol dehydrogenase family)
MGQARNPAHRPKGRAVLVTGGSRGIGRAIAEVLGEEGYALTITSRQAQTLESTAEDLRAMGFEVETVVGDVADESAIKDIVARHRERFGRLDVLVNNAGIGVLAGMGDHLASDIDSTFAVNLRAAALFYREALDLLRAAGAEHGNAQVVNVSSVSGWKGDAWLGAYSASKAGLIGLNNAMNEELNAYGIKSVALCPGYVDTDMTAFAKEHALPAEGMLRAQDVAESVRFLLRVSPRCVVPQIVLHRPVEQPPGLPDESPIVRVNMTPARSVAG